MADLIGGLLPKRHCRIGSSENLKHLQRRVQGRHCRIGSSEMQKSAVIEEDVRHWRIGSSERNPCDRYRP